MLFLITGTIWELLVRPIFSLLFSYSSTQYCVLLYHANFRYDYGTLGSLGTISDRFRGHMSITMHKNMHTQSSHG